MLTPNGDLIIPKGTSLGFKGHLPWLKDHSSIYLILRNETNEAYIGSSIDLSTRFRSHRDCGTSTQWINTSHLLYSAIGKYGTDAFTFTEIHPPFPSLNERKKLMGGSGACPLRRSAPQSRGGRRAVLLYQLFFYKSSLNWK